MLMLFACFATFLFTSSKAEMVGWERREGGLLVMEGSGSSVDRASMFDRAAVKVAIKKWDTGEENKLGAN